MGRGPRRRACALAVVVAVLAGALGAGSPVSRGCNDCPPGCPMHARRLSCHHASAPPCHRARALPGLRAACHHANDTVPPAGGFRAVMPATAVTLAGALAPRRREEPARVVSRPEPEPVSPPPRALAV